MASSPLELALIQQHAALCALIPELGSTVLLQIGAQLTGISSRLGDAAPSAWMLEMGTLRAVSKHFKGGMPDALALENAIAATEDEIAKLPKTIAAPAVLLSQDALVRAIALRSGLRDGSKIEMPLEVVERCFDRLAKVVQGSPAAYEGLPQDPTFAATLLILREFMHHRRFASVTWVSAI